MTYSFYKGRTGVQPATGGGVQEVLGDGNAISVDNTDPQRPIVQAQFALFSETVNSMWSGIWAAPVAVPLSYTDIGGSMTITLRENVLEAATTPGFIELTNPLPSQLWPPAFLQFPIKIKDDLTDGLGLAILSPTDGSIKIYKDINLSNFSGNSSGGALSGFYATTFSYRI